MKATRLYWVLSLIAMVSFNVCSGKVHATERLSGSNVIVPASRVIDDDLVAAGSDVQMLGQVKGDLMAFGSNISVSGPVQNDLLAAGANIDIHGPVGNALRAAGATVTIAGPVKNNATVAGGTVIMQPAASVGRDASLAGGDVTVQGRVGHDLMLAAGSARIGAEIGHSVRAQTNHLILLPGSVVHGDLTVDSPAPPEISPRAKVLGQVVYHHTAASSNNTGPSSWLGSWIFWFVSLLILGAVVLSLAQPWAEHVVDTIKQRPGPCALVGLAVLLLPPIVGILLAITLVGIPLALLLLALYAAILLLAGVFVAHLVGEEAMRRLKRPQLSPYAKFAAGALLVTFLCALPVVGWLCQLAVLLFGSGGLVLQRWGERMRQRERSLA